MSEFARRNLIIAEGLASNIEDSEEEQIFHLKRAAKGLKLEKEIFSEDTCKDIRKDIKKDIDEVKAFLWKEVNKSSAFKLPTKLSFPKISLPKKLIKILFFLLTPLLAIILIKNSLPEKKLKWEAKYYSNSDLSGKEALTTQNDKISFKWEGSKPLKNRNNISADKFSAKYKSCLTLNQRSELKLILGSDDGSKLFINNIEIINNWKKQGYNEVRKVITLEKGTHKFEIHYFQAGGSSRLEFSVRAKQENNPVKYELDRCQ